jgi:hypothetical protein
MGHHASSGTVLVSVVATPSLLCSLSTRLHGVRHEEVPDSLLSGQDAFSCHLLLISGFSDFAKEARLTKGNQGHNPPQNGTEPELECWAGAPGEGRSLSGHSLDGALFDSCYCRQHF